MDPVRTPIRFRVIGAVFALGAVVHATGFLALLFRRELPFYPGYPALRHLAFATADATLTWLALVRPRVLVLPLAALLAEQLATHGASAWHAWTIGHEIDAFDLAILGLEMAAVLIALEYALRLSRATTRGYPVRPVLAVLVTLTVALVCAAWIDRPFADFVEANFYGTPAFSAISFLLGGLRAILVVLVLAFLGCAYWIARGRTLAPWGVVVWACSRAAVVAVVTAVALKFAIGRSGVYPAYVTERLYEIRPFHWSPDYGAFPSAAATVTTAIATVLCRRLPRWRAFWLTVSIALLGGVLAVNGHWVSDVLAGVCLGVLIGARAATAAGGRGTQAAAERAISTD